MSNGSRRNFLAAGLSLPMAASGARLSPQAPQRRVTPPELVSPRADFKYQILGKTGLKVTSVGFGCMITSDGSVIQRAADLGITYFDTARGYSSGNNERMVGAALKGKRKDVVLSTKSHGGSKEDALRDLDKSLSELGTDYVDIWYLHGKSSGSQLTDDLIEAQQIAKKQGKARFAGVSTHGGQKEVIAAMIEKKCFDVVLAAFNFTMTNTLDAALADAHKAGLGVVAMKVMAGGFRRTRPGDKTYNTLKRDGAMVSALKWVLKNPSIDTTIPSITDMDQLDENVKAMASPYSGADEKLLAEHLRFIDPLYCRMCGECNGQCPQGLPVADVMRFLTYAEGYGQFGLGRERYLEMGPELAQVKCSQCPSCSVTCPYSLKIAQRLGRAQELFA